MKFGGLFFGILAALLLNFHDAQAIKSNCTKWGTDSVRSVQEISLYREFFKQKNFDDAIRHWRYVFKNAPGARKQTYIDGVKMYESFIKKHKEDKEKRKLLSDTLMMIYDQRIKCYGEKGNVLSRKGMAMYKYRYGTKEDLHNVLDEAIRESGNASKYYVLYPYLLTAVEIMKKEEKLTKEEVLKKYQNVAAILDHNTDPANKSKNAEKYAAQREKIDVLLKEIITNCDDAKAVFAKRYVEEPDNEKLLQSIFDLLKNTKCTDDPIFLEVTMKLFEKQQKSNLAYFISKKVGEQGQHQDAINYLKKAIELEEDANTKANYYLELASIYSSKLGDYGSARSQALKAAETKSGWGDPYLFIGDLYASSGKKCGPGTGFESQVVSWVAVDMYLKAKSVDPSISDKANNKIAIYRGFFPTKEDIFFRGLKEGDPYTVACWINKSTTIRARKE